MYPIGATYSGANSLFFTIRGIEAIPRMVHAGYRRRSIFFADDHLGREARFTSVGIEGKTPHWQGTGLAIGPVDIWHNVQSGRRKRRLCSKPRLLSGQLSVSSGDNWQKVLFPGRFVRRIPFCGAIFRATPFLSDYI
jgi:hypothetical protein